jgi:hypothetical protein
VVNVSDFVTSGLSVYTPFSSPLDTVPALHLQADKPRMVLTVNPTQTASGFTCYFDRSVRGCPIPQSDCSLAFSSVVLVNGMRAVAFYDPYGYSLMYTTALDVEGTVWASPITVDYSAYAALAGVPVMTAASVSMTLIGTFPAVAYLVGDGTGADAIWYCRATDVNGTAWSAPIQAVSTGWPRRFVSLAQVNATAAIVCCLTSSGMGVLNYIRSNSPAGTDFASATRVPFRMDPKYPDDVTAGQLLNANGFPYIQYSVPGDLSVRATWSKDVSGLDFNNPGAYIVFAGATGSVDSMTAHRYLADGAPSVLYQSNLDNLMFQRMVDGTNTTYTAVTNPNAGVAMSFAYEIINGNPAVAYRTKQSGATSTIRYTRCATANGGTGLWGTPRDLNTGGAKAGNANLAMVVLPSGAPAVAWGDGSNITYSYGLDVNGATFSAQLTVVAAASTPANLTMAVISGAPTLFWTLTDTSVAWSRATDANGTAWGAVTTMSASAGAGIRVLVLNNLPRIVALSTATHNVNLYTSTDAIATAFDTGSVFTDNGTAIVVNAIATTMQSVISVAGGAANQLPILVYAAASAGLRCKVASDVNGTNWTTNVSSYIGGLTSTDNSTGTSVTYDPVTNHASITYRPTQNNSTVWFYKASDAGGRYWSTQWFPGSALAHMDYSPSAQAPFLVMYDSAGKRMTYVTLSTPTNHTNQTSNPTYVIRARLAATDSVQGRWDPVNSVPCAIWNANGQRTQFCRANSSTGATWYGPVNLDSTANATCADLYFTGGRPSSVSVVTSANSLRSISSMDVSMSYIAVAE